MLGRAKLHIGGIIAMLAGFFTATGVEGMALQGVGVFLCGLALVGLSAWAQIREERQAATILRKQQQEALKLAIRGMEARQRQTGCDGHVWAVDDAALNVNVFRRVCLKCGAEEPGEA